MKRVREFRTLASLSSSIPWALERLVQKLNEVYYQRYDLNSCVAPWRVQVDLPEGNSYSLLFEQYLYDGDLDKIRDLYAFNDALAQNFKFYPYLNADSLKRNPHTGQIENFQLCKAKFNAQQIEEILRTFDFAQVPRDRVISNRPTGHISHPRSQ